MTKHKVPVDEEKMKQLITFAIALLTVGAALVAYAHANFASKSTVEKLDDRIYDLWMTLPPDKRNASKD